jgi:hypothetical protein
MIINNQMNVQLIKVKETEQIIFNDDYRICPNDRCCGIVKLNIQNKQIEASTIKLSKCKSVKCFSTNHQYCPDCYTIIHVNTI